MGREAITIEFLGLPGVGKSALAHRVAGLLADRGHPISEPSHDLAHRFRRPVRLLRKSVHVARECVTQPRHVGRAARALGRSGQRSRFLVVKMLFNWLLVSRLARSARCGRGIRIHDQGIYQGLWSIGLGSDGRLPAVAPDLAGSLPQPDLLAVVIASRPEVERRLRERPDFDSRLDRLSLIDPRILDRSADLLETVRRLPGQIAAGPPEELIIRNESIEDLELQARGLADLLESRLRAMSTDELPTRRTADVR